MTDLPTHLIRMADLAARKPTHFALEPDAEAREALARHLGIRAIKRLSFKGTLAPSSKRDWRLTADLGASAAQLCVVSLEPVTSRIDTKVSRLYMAEWEEPEASEVEMPGETEAEPLPATLDLYAVAGEALALALPDFPRAEGARLARAQAAPEGVAPLQDEDLKPFAGLAGLRDKLAGDGGSE